MGDFGRFLAVLGAGLALAACGTTASPAGSTDAAAAKPAAQAPSPTAVAHASATPSATPSATASKRATPKATPTPTHAAPPPPATTTGQPTPRYGNPNGHAAVPVAAQAVSYAHPNHVIGTGTPASCTSAWVVKAVAKGGIIAFNCGPNPVTITMTATATVPTSHSRTVIDGGGKVTLSGGGSQRILYMNSGWEQQYPLLVVQNLTFEDAYSGVQQTSTSDYGGGAIYDDGGQLKVVNSGFIDDKCYQSGPDLGGAAIRAFGMYQGAPVYITDDTFRGGRCSNGGALSSIAAAWSVYNSFFTDNKAIGWGANPQASGTPGGGSGGAIYTDGDHYNVLIDGTVIHYNNAPEGGSAIFFVVDADGGTLTIEDSTLDHNPRGAFQNAPGIFDSVNGQDTQPVMINSSVQ